jgi:hypothetical protein
LLTQSPSCEADLVTRGLFREDFLATQISSCEEHPSVRESEEESPAFLFDGKRASFMLFWVGVSAATTCVHFAESGDFGFKFAAGDPNFVGVEAVDQR